MTPANPDALADALNREPVELADDVTPQEVMRLALDGIDLAYRAHGNNARVSMLAVQADWIMQHLARTEMWAKDEQAKRHAAEDRLVEARSRAAAAEARAAQLQAEVEALKEDRADAERTVEQWFDTKAKSVEQIRPKLAEALGGYLRVCRCGGMSAEESELVEATLGDFLRRQSGSIVAPVVETMVAERLAARAATAREGQADA